MSAILNLYNTVYCLDTHTHTIDVPNILSTISTAFNTTTVEYRAVTIHYVIYDRPYLIIFCYVFMLVILCDTQHVSI